MSDENILEIEYNCITDTVDKECKTTYLESFADLFSRVKYMSEIETRFYKDLNDLFKQYRLKKGDLIVGPDLGNCRISPESFKRKLHDPVITSISDEYRKQFVGRRKIRLLGIDLDDCIYDNTPVRDKLIENIRLVMGSNAAAVKATEAYNVCKDELNPDSLKIDSLSNLLESDGKVYNKKFEIANKVFKVYRDFMSFQDCTVNSLYEPYKNAKSALKNLMDGNGIVIGIITNGSSIVQRKKLKVLGLAEGSHFDFVLVSEDIQASKPSKEIFAKSVKMASSYVQSVVKSNNRGDEIVPSQCLILEDRVRNTSGAEGWLKVQFLKGRHRNKLPGTPNEIPKYGISSFESLTAILEMENNALGKDILSSYFIFKSLVLMHLLQKD